MRDDEGRSRRFAKQLRRRLTDAETILWSRLRHRADAKFRRQHPIGIYIADFACIAARLIIEVDGATHSSDQEISYDLARTVYLEQRGWRVVRVTNENVYKNLDDTLSAIVSLLPPPPLCGPPPP
jgi:very-short-patch-repair endonuclease